MNDQTVLDLSYVAVIIAMKIAAPGLIAILVTGLVVSVLQAATQVNEQTLAFIPKVLAVSLVLMLCGSWLVRTMVNYTNDILESVAYVTR